MSDNWKTLRVPPEAYDEAKAQKEDADRTWGEQIVRPEDADTTDDSGLPEDLRAQLDRIESSASTAEERAGRVESTLEDMEGRMR